MAVAPLHERFRRKTYQVSILYRIARPWLPFCRLVFSRRLAGPYRADTVKAAIQEYKDWIRNLRRWRRRVTRLMLSSRTSAAQRQFAPTRGRGASASATRGGWCSRRTGWRRCRPRRRPPPFRPRRPSRPPSPGWATGSRPRRSICGGRRRTCCGHRARWRCCGPPETTSCTGSRRALYFTSAPPAPSLRVKPHLHVPLRPSRF